MGRLPGSNSIHGQEVPEYFTDVICTGTGKSMLPRFCEYEVKKLRSPACCRQNNATFHLLFTEPGKHTFAPVPVVIQGIKTKQITTPYFSGLVKFARVLWWACNQGNGRRLLLIVSSDFQRTSSLAPSRTVHKQTNFVSRTNGLPTEIKAVSFSLTFERGLCCDRL